MILFCSKDNSGEQGSVMVVALVILVLLTIIGISATTTTNIETQIAGNEKVQKIAFYTADSGVPTSAKLISAIIDSQTQPTLADVEYAEVGGVTDPLLRQIMGYDPYDGGDPRDDVTFTFGSNTTASADIERTGTEILAGGGVEFGSGAEGVGGGAAGGGVAIFYDIDSLGEGPSNSQSNIVAGYRKVVGVAGGL
ncbi:MAG: hypothetical protein JW944_06105 [Deltaproteobacteria bacterium]|nr:hypothetical protein [Deltaproteobacteria bacterium]